MEAFGRAAGGDVRIYLVGGTTAVLMGWRASTIDVDFVMRPDDDALLRVIPSLKERLRINVEMVSPADFIPVPPGWEDRGIFIAQVGRAAFYHFDAGAREARARSPPRPRRRARDARPQPYRSTAPGGVLRRIETNLTGSRPSTRRASDARSNRPSHNDSAVIVQSRPRSCSSVPG